MDCFPLIIIFPPHSYHWGLCYFFISWNLVANTTGNPPALLFLYRYMHTKQKKRFDQNPYMNFEFDIWVIDQSLGSRWLDIGQVLFLRVYGLRQSQGPLTYKKRTRPMSSHLEWKSLANKGFIKDFRRIFSILPAYPITERDLVHLACSWS